MNHFNWWVDLCYSRFIEFTLVLDGFVFISPGLAQGRGLRRQFKMQKLFIVSL